jgi:hypothetical protein
MTRGGCFTNEGKSIDPKDKAGGILSLHKHIIDRLHVDYVMFTKWEEEFIFHVFFANFLEEK